MMPHVKGTNISVMGLARLLELNMQTEENLPENKPIEPCPQCGDGNLSSRNTKRYSFIDIFGYSVLVLFVSGLLYTGIFGRYSIALLIVEVYVIIKVLPKFISYKIISKQSCEHCGYSQEASN